VGILKIRNFKASVMFLENSKEAVEAMSGCDSFLPENIKDISNELFSLKGVYACDSPVIDGRPVRTERSLSDTAILKNVKSYLNKGAEVHMYQYYGLKQGVGELGLINTYWWRFMATKK